jgi:cobalt-zinc-cadmium efflux system protein
MAHHHHHHHHHHGTGKKLMWSLGVTLAFVVLEVIAGLRAGSLALLSDAGHNFTDALALGLAAFGFYLESKPADSSRTYGYKRAGVLAAFVNALTLVALSFFIFYESYFRLVHPEPVDNFTMIWVAALGVLVNGGIMLVLQHQKEHDLNVRAAWIHMAGDALGSAAIIAGAFLIRYTGWLRVDPLLSIAIAALIIWTARDIIKESLNILLEGLPAGVELKQVIGEMRSVEGVVDVHDLHIWTLGSNAHALSCHVLIEDMPPSSSEGIRQRINGVLHDRFQIDHTTVQFEHTPCAAEGNCCSFLESTASRMTNDVSDLQKL